MANKKVKWLIYTVLVGLIPILARMLVWSVSRSPKMELLNTSDLVAFGLVLHISNINEIEHLNSSEHSWKTIHNGTSIVFISFYGILFAVSLISSSNPNLIHQDYLENLCIHLA